jgi:hypothetical protein
MKSRHAVALALVGWYLLLPPIISGPLTNGQIGRKLSDGEPYSRWKAWGSYDSASECEAQRQLLFSRSAAEAGKIASASGCGSAAGCDPIVPNSPTTLKGLELVRQMVAECIASDDPRLKAP